MRGVSCGRTPVVKGGRGAYNKGMEFLREIANLLGGADAFRIHYTVVDGRGAYLENVRRLAVFTPTEIVAMGRRGGVRVEGEDLSIGRYTAGDLVIRGNIVRVTREGGGEKL